MTTYAITRAGDSRSFPAAHAFLDQADPGIVRHDVTVIDHALTRPWTVLKSYRRDPSPRPVWVEYNCSENNNHVRIGNDNYMMSADGNLMPTKKGQRPPDFQHFKQSPK